MKRVEFTTNCCAAASLVTFLAAVVVNWNMDGDEKEGTSKENGFGPQHTA